MNDAEINRAIVQKVLGWELELVRPDGAWWKLDIPTPTPDFLTWDGFGLLLEAIQRQGQDVYLGFDSEDWCAEVNWHRYVQRHQDVRVALRDSVCLAYGIR